MVNLQVKIGGLTLKNPVMTASGTFGYGTEYADFIDLSRLGGIIVKGTTLHHREGNPYPRMAETPSGMLNAVGLQNKGVDYFIEHIYPEIKSFDTNVLVNVSGSCIEDYVTTAEKIDALEKVPAIELNISCPNVKQGGMAFGTSAKQWLIQKKKEKLLRDIIMTNMSIAELADKYRFSVNYLTTFCKEHFGKSPTELRSDGFPIKINDLKT